MLRDLDEVLLSDSGTVRLQKDAVYTLRRAEADRLVRDGFALYMWSRNIIFMMYLNVLSTFVNQFVFSFSTNYSISPETSFLSIVSDFLLTFLTLLVHFTYFLSSICSQFICSVYFFIYLYPKCLAFEAFLRNALFRYRKFFRNFKCWKAWL